MEKTVQISVVIPVYNCQKYIHEAVASVLNQPISGTKIVLVDDGSSDDSAAICDRLSEKYGEVTAIHKRNGGVSSARNVGIEYVLEQYADDLLRCYIAFLDADDKWMENFLNESTLDLLSGGYHLIGFQTCRCNKSATRGMVPLEMCEGLRKGGADNVWDHSTQTFGAMLYSAELIKRFSIRFFDGLRANEDKIFSIHCMYLADSIYLVNQVMYLYRNNPFSASHRSGNGIEKYTPMIEAYLKSDEMMKVYQSETRGELNAGRKMAAVYIIDMTEEHFQTFGKVKDIETVFKERANYIELMNSRLICDIAETSQRWNAMKESGLKFKVRCYAKGIARIIKCIGYAVLSRSKFIFKQIERIRYPVILK